MKLRLIMKTLTKKNKELTIKFNIAPSKHLGFINFVNLALKQDIPVTLSFEKIGKSGTREESKIVGTFKFTGKDTLALRELTDEVQENKRKRKK